jgi:hypothetical protein
MKIGDVTISSNFKDNIFYGSKAISFIFSHIGKSWLSFVIDISAPHLTFGL